MFSPATTLCAEVLYAALTLRYEDILSSLFGLVTILGGDPGLRERAERAIARRRWHRRECC